MTSPRFEYQIIADKAEVHLRVWDYWTDAEGAAYRDAMFKVSQQMAHHKAWKVLIDATKSPPQSPAVQRFRQETLEYGKANGLSKVAYIVENALTEQQVERLNANAGNAATFFHARPEALAWLRKP